MVPILRVRDKDGNVHEIPAIVGPRGPEGPPGPAGSGSGDMAAVMYDPQSKRTDIFKYVDDKVKDLDVDVTASDVTFADGQTFQQKYDSGQLTGPQGPEGRWGPGYYPTVDADGNLSWERLSGAFPDAETVNIKGPAGANATINGANALTLATGAGLSGSQSGSTYTLTLATHNQAASTITGGTFAGEVAAAASAQTPGNSLLRNSALVIADTTPTNNGEIFWTYG